MFEKYDLKECQYMLSKTKAIKRQGMTREKKKWQEMSRYANNSKEWQSVVKCQGMQRNAKEYQGMARNAKECQRMPKNAKECQRMPKNTKECQGILNFDMNFKVHLFYSRLECRSVQCSVGLLFMFFYHLLWPVMMVIAW